MTQSRQRSIAERLRSLGNEMLAIANELDAQAPHLSVNLPRDLFSDLFGEPMQDSLDGLTVRQQNDAPEEEPVKPQRHYVRNGRPMREHLSVVSSDKLGKRQGFCARNDIERSIVRMTGRSREDVREAVNRVAAQMQITCVVSRSYRYYPRSKRHAIVEAAIKELINI